MPKKKISFLKTYRFASGSRDPIMDCVHNLMERQGLSVAEVNDRSHVAKTTLYHWRAGGKTRRPQYATICAALRAVGFDINIVESGYTEGQRMAEEPSIIFSNTKRKQRSNGATDHVSAA